MSRRGKSVKLRRTRQKILLIVEGSAHKSEQTYFQLLARELRSENVAVDVKVIPGQGEPSKLLSKCLAEKERHSGLYDHYCLVVDVDQHAKLEGVLREAAKNQISVVVTNPQFELWLLLHVSDCRREISGSRLDDEVSKFNLTTGRNGKELSRNFPVSNYRDACKRARALWPEMAPGRIGPNPSSAIPWLIDALENGIF